MMTALASPYFMVRVSALPFHFLNALKCIESNLVCEEIWRCRRRRESLRELVCQTLFHSLPKRSNSDRRALLAIKRSVYNDSVPQGGILKSVKFAQRILGPNESRPYRTWAVYRWREERLITIGRTLFSEDIARNSNTLRELALTESVLGSLQLSGIELSERIEQYCRNTEASPDKRLDRTIASYVVRMATKPSPFAEFARVELGFWSKYQSSVVEDKRLIRLTRLFLENIVQGLAKIPSCASTLSFCPNHQYVGRKVV